MINTVEFEPNLLASGLAKYLEKHKEEFASENMFVEIDVKVLTELIKNYVEDAC